MTTSQLNKAVRLYSDFHQLEPIALGAFHRGFRIPWRAVYVGEAITMFYCSDKLNPGTGENEGWIHYYHQHGPGVGVYRCDGEAIAASSARAVPRSISSVNVLARLGDCEGYRYTTPEGETVKAQVEEPLPEWYATPSGKALLIVQDKRRVLAMLWGGDLDVRPEGVTG